MNDNRYTGIHVLHVTTTVTIMMAKSSKLSYIDQGSETIISSSALYATGHVSLHDKPSHLM